MRFDERNVERGNDAMCRTMIAAVGFGIRAIADENAFERPGAQFRVVGSNKGENATANLA